nr:hypothetical protein DA06_30780 [Georgenia sp. SUBG003]
MIRYLAARFAAVTVVLFLVCLFTFVIFFVLSPDPAVQICGKTCTPSGSTRSGTTSGSTSRS